MNVETVSEELRSSLPPAISPWRGALYRFFKNRVAVWGLFGLALALTFSSVLPRFLALIHKGYTPFVPGLWTTNLPWTWRHPCGTGLTGCDSMMELAGAAEISFVNALLGSIIAMWVGVSLGLVSGYVGGWMDRVLMRCADVVDCVPKYFLFMLWSTLFDSPRYFTFCPMASVWWIDFARMVRGQVIDIKHKEYIEAAQAGGVSAVRICCFHILPNLMGQLIVEFGQTVRAMILAEAFLGFVNIGIASPRKTVGCLMWSHAYGGVLEAAFWPTAGWFMLALLSLNSIVDGLRDAFDPKDR